MAGHDNAVAAVRDVEEVDSATPVDGTPEEGDERGDGRAVDNEDNARMMDVDGGWRRVRRQAEPLCWVAVLLPEAVVAMT